MNIVNRIAAAVGGRGWRLAFHPDTETERLKAAHRRGYALFHMHEPLDPNTLCLRRAYIYPFWQIEATNERWNFDVARAAFDPASVNPAQAAEFYGRWRGKVHGQADLGGLGYVLIPLQGRLTAHRSFQAASPIDMIRATLRADPARPVRATLHPKEVYSIDDHAALTQLAASHPRFSVMAASDDLVRGCDYIVTQNSSVVLDGFFAGKPAVQFARTDLHHIAGSVHRLGVDAAFASVRGPVPDFAAYLSWFLRRHCINGGAPQAEDQILARFARHGWQI